MQLHTLITGAVKAVKKAACALAFSSVAMAHAEPLTILVTDSDLHQYRLFVAKRNPTQITDFNSPHSNREAVEIVLLHQALHLGGFRGEITLVPENNYSRILRLVESGAAHLSSTTVWSLDLSDTGAYWVSDPLVRKGEFAVGVYVRPDNTQALNARKLDDYTQLTAVSNRMWQVDWSTLEAMGVAHLHHINTMGLMVKMIGAGRGDFMLAPFSTSDDLALKESGVHLVPVPGVKVVLDDSRHWIASKKHPLGEHAFNAIQTGLTQLRENGTIVRAYEQSGFFNPAVKNWLVLNSPGAREALAKESADSDSPPVTQSDTPRPDDKLSHSEDTP